MKLACKKCGALLTDELVRLDDVARLSVVRGESRIPKRFFHVARSDSDFEKLGSIVVNLEDLTGAGHAKDGRPYNGCCGIDGCDGLNLVCPGGHNVGTERSDCWMPHSATFESELVTFAE